MNQLPKSVGAVGPHATFCGNLRRVTASGEPLESRMAELLDDHPGRLGRRRKIGAYAPNCALRGYRFEANYSAQIFLIGFVKIGKASLA